MEQLYNGFTLALSKGAFPLSTDSIALSSFVRLPKQAKVLDLGAGCGTLGLYLCAKDPACKVTGIEIDEHAHKMALRNIENNGLTSRLSSICTDLRTVPSFIAAGSFHCCVSNPPYFSARQESANGVARHEQLCTLDDLFSAAQWAVKFGGDFFLVHKPERLAELCACAAKHSLEPKRLLLLRHRPGDPIALILLQCRKGAKPGLTIEEEALQDEAGKPSEYYRRLYHI
ncbi:MAG: methyltransferase [Oscillospiraceae bacterium]|nr:methyltransferase [Oscillospiraceae bacterium]